MAIETSQPPQSAKRTTDIVESVPSVSPDAVPVFITPPLSLDSVAHFHCSESEVKKKSIVYGILDILKGARPGSDLTSFQVPPQYNLPKSQLQLYAEQVHCCGQNLLELCTDASTPLDRFLAVVRWQISLLRPTIFGKAPFNPILGETHHVTNGSLNVLVEQVSHHPPITAIYATNDVKNIQISQCLRVIPRFYGTSVEVKIDGKRILNLAEHGELYEMHSPNLNFRFMPTTCSEWTGDANVRCAGTDLEAVITLKPRSYLSRLGSCNRVCGKILTASTQEVLYTLSGQWDDMVTIKNEMTGKTSPFYNGKIALSNLQKSVVQNLKVLSPMESVIVWNKVTRAVWNQDWETARVAKSTVEEHQRTLRKQRLAAGLTWRPKYFSRNVHGEWEWALKGQSVPTAPIVALRSTV